MTDYVLTSDPAVHPIAEEGRRAALSLAADHIGRAQRSALYALKEAMDGGSFSEYELNGMNSSVAEYLYTAREYLKVACSSDRFERERYGFVTRVAYLESLPALIYPSQPSWDGSVRAIMTGYREYLTGVTLERLTVFYGATDPAVPDDYAQALLDA